MGRARLRAGRQPGRLRRRGGPPVDLRSGAVSGPAGHRPRRRGGRVCLLSRRRQAAPAVAPAARPPPTMPGMGAQPAARIAPDTSAPDYVLFDPQAPVLLPGTVHDVDLPIIEKDMTVAPGFVVHVWTFGGTVPGPTIRVKIGDTVRVHLTNQGQMPHSIDFHASQTAMDHQMVEIKPGATWTYTFKAEYAGVWMYHCGTAPTLHHIANGMFGMVIVEPRWRAAEGGPRVRLRPERVVSREPGAAGRLHQGVAGAPDPDSSSSTAWPRSTRRTRSR